MTSGLLLKDGYDFRTDDKEVLCWLMQFQKIQDKCYVAKGWLFFHHIIVYLEQYYCMIPTYL
jgi:hypothetical protein